MVLGHLALLACPDLVDDLTMLLYLKNQMWVWDQVYLFPLSVPFLLLPLLFIAALSYGAELRFPPELLTAVSNAEVHLQVRAQVRGCAYLPP